LDDFSAPSLIEKTRDNFLNSQLSTINTQPALVVTSSPLLDALRGDPRFEQIVASLAPKDAASPTK
jgi:hypothetical protein